VVKPEKIFKKREKSLCNILLRVEIKQKNSVKKENSFYFSIPDLKIVFSRNILYKFSL